MKNLLRSVFQTVSGYTLFWVILHSRPTRYLLLDVLKQKGLYWRGLHRPYPYDVENGTDTGGTAPSGGSKTDHPYWGAAPSVLRVALARLPAPAKLLFIDLGCGKGRPLLVASEFPFRAILGIELSEALAGVGQANAAIMARRHPERTRVEVRAGDVVNFQLPPGDIALYLYNPFGEELMRKVVAEVEASLAANPRTIFVIYQNPVAGHCFDASPALRRYHAATIPYAWEERGFRWDVHDISDAVVIWQGGPTPLAPLPGAEARIEVVRMQYTNRAKLAG